jgi:hypothetical protein
LFIPGGLPPCFHAIQEPHRKVLTGGGIGALALPLALNFLGFASPLTSLLRVAGITRMAATPTREHCGLQSAAILTPRDEKGLVAPCSGTHHYTSVDTEILLCPKQPWLEVLPHPVSTLPD